MAKSYNSVLELVKDTMPEIAEDFEQHQNLLMAIKGLINALPPNDRLAVTTHICRYCGEIAAGEYWFQPYCSLCEEQYKEDQKKREQFNR